MKELLYILVLSVIGAFLGLVLWHKRQSKKERNNLKKPGQYVRVFGRNMHLVCRGEGSSTIVLLSGFATSCPAVDFSPLIKRLEQVARVIVVEGFGYGWSEETNRSRTNDHIVEELRLALRKTGVKPPYIFGVHSLSGIYSLSYCQRYPTEVAGIVALDTTVPNQFRYMEEKLFVRGWYRYFTYLGFVRLGLEVFPKLFLPPENGVYTAYEQQIIFSKYSTRAFNRNLVDECNRIEENTKAVSEVSYPSNIPQICFLSNETQESSKDWDRTWKCIHKDLLQNLERKKIVMVEAGHYLHWEKGEELCREIIEFFKLKDTN